MRAVPGASVLVEPLLLGPSGENAASRVRAADGDLHVPHLADVESVSVLRGLVLGGHLAAARAASALIDLRDLPAARWPADALFERIWTLRAHLTASDANYIAMPEVLDAELLTFDAKLSRAAEGLAQCSVTVIA